MNDEKIVSGKLLLGRKEWCELPDLNIPAIKAKIDTGAKTSAIHAINITPDHSKKGQYIHFDIDPIVNNEKFLLHCDAPVKCQRYVMSSNGQKEYRYIISTLITISNVSWEIELSLTNRESLTNRLLLGREALNGRALIDPSVSFNQKKINKQALIEIYSKIT